jgi:hypothetical protein
LKFNSRYVQGAKHWLLQTTTAFGMAGGFATLTAIATGAVKWTDALCVLPGVLYLLAHPERIPQEIPEETVKQIGETLKAVAERGQRRRSQ